MGRRPGSSGVPFRGCGVLVSWGAPPRWGGEDSDGRRASYPEGLQVDGAGVSAMLGTGSPSSPQVTAGSFPWLLSARQVTGCCERCVWLLGCAACQGVFRLFSVAFVTRTESPGGQGRQAEGPPTPAGRLQGTRRLPLSAEGWRVQTWTIS